MPRDNKYLGLAQLSNACAFTYPYRLRSQRSLVASGGQKTPWNSSAFKLIQNVRNYQLPSERGYSLTVELRGIEDGLDPTNRRLKIAGK